MGEGSIERYLGRASERLSQNRFRISENVTADGHTFPLVGRRTRLEPTKFGFTQTVFVFNAVSDVDGKQFQELSSASFEFARTSSTPFLPRGFGRMVLCYSVVVTSTVDEQTRKTLVANDAPKHWSAFEFPVIIDAETGRLSHFEGTPAWGAAYYRGFRKRLEKILGT
jgi:hypothetical protein